MCFCSCLKVCSVFWCSQDLIQQQELNYLIYLQRPELKEIQQAIKHPREHTQSTHAHPHGHKSHYHMLFSRQNQIMLFSWAAQKYANICYAQTYDSPRKVNVCWYNSNSNSISNNNNNHDNNSKNIKWKGYGQKLQASLPGRQKRSLDC